MTLAPRDLQTLRIPDPPIPRPGEQVCWYADARLVTGKYLGHSSSGKPLTVNQFGNPGTPSSFPEIRLLNPLIRLGPNWTRLPGSALIVDPSTDIQNRFDALLGRHIPPGPTYLSLAQEIWSRGFEIFVVGGTVRDVLSGQAPNDVDFVTTMPLSLMGPMVRNMYRYNPSASGNRGFIRIGGSPSSGDPFIDLKVFSDSLPGTREATFGVDFQRDVAHRDFACNAVYYDPINKALIDPTGTGIADCWTRKLRLICETSDHQQHAQIFLRFFKFCQRGFQPTGDTITRICSEYAAAVPSMKQIMRIQYFRAQVISKASREDKLVAVEAIRSQMTTYGMKEIWDNHFAPLVEDLLS